LNGGLRAGAVIAGQKGFPVRRDQGHEHFGEQFREKPAGFPAGPAEEAPMVGQVLAGALGGRGNHPRDRVGTASSF
jgi:hypothetical protein